MPTRRRPPAARSGFEEAAGCTTVPAPALDHPSSRPPGAGTRRHSPARPPGRRSADEPSMRRTASSHQPGIRTGALASAAWMARTACRSSPRCDRHERRTRVRSAHTDGRATSSASASARPAKRQPRRRAGPPESVRTSGIAASRPGQRAGAERSPATELAFGSALAPGGDTRREQGASSARSRCRRSAPRSPSGTGAVAGPRPAAAVIRTAARRLPQESAPHQAECPSGATARYRVPGPATTTGDR